MFKNLMFITHSDESAVQLEQVRKACEAGVEWIQVRIKAHSKEEIKELKEVVVGQNFFSRKQMLKLFREQFLGINVAGKNCIIENEEEIYEIGWEEALSDGILLIEWPERLGSLLPSNYTEIIITPLSGESRHINVIHHGKETL